MREFWDLFMVLIGAAIVVAVAFGGLFVAFAVANKIECGNLHEVTKRHTEFRWFGGCYVEHEGELLPYEKWKLLDLRVKERK